MRSNYPNFFLERLKNLFGSNFNKVIAAYSRKPTKAIRINTTKVEVNRCLSRLRAKGYVLSKVPWSNYIFFLMREPKPISTTVEYLMGYFYVLDPASTLPPIELSPSQNDLVLDMAASPGGKTTHLSQLMNNKGTIVAVDSNKERLDSLKNNIERMGAQNVIVLNADSRNLQKIGVQFDKILLDAPCSSDGTMAKNPELRKKIKKEDYARFQKLQKSLVKSAYNLLKKGGILVYSTCSTAPEENEEVVEFAVNELGFKLLPLKTGKYIDKGMVSFFGQKHSQFLSKCGRIVPFKYNTQAFFLAKLVKV